MGVFVNFDKDSKPAMWKYLWKDSVHQLKRFVFTTKSPRVHKNTCINRNNKTYILFIIYFSQTIIFLTKLTHFLHPDRLEFYALAVREPQAYRYNEAPSTRRYNNAVMFEGFQGAFNWTSIMTRGDNLSDGFLHREIFSESY